MHYPQILTYLNPDDKVRCSTPTGNAFHVLDCRDDGDVDYDDDAAFVVAAVVIVVDVS